VVRAATHMHRDSAAHPFTRLSPHELYLPPHPTPFSPPVSIPTLQLCQQSHTIPSCPHPHHSHESPPLPLSVKSCLKQAVGLLFSHDRQPLHTRHPFHCSCHRKQERIEARGETSAEPTTWDLPRSPSFALGVVGVPKCEL
jgi:hypothetical protein